jgi:hypothetical protein
MTHSPNEELHKFTEYVRDIVLEMLEIQAKILEGLADKSEDLSYREGVMDCVVHLRGTAEVGRGITREEIQTREGELSQIYRAVASSKFTA